MESISAKIPLLKVSTLLNLILILSCICVCTNGVVKLEVNVVFVTVSILVPAKYCSLVLNENYVFLKY